MFAIMAYVRQQKADLTQKFPRAMLGADSTSFGQQGNLGSTTPLTQKFPRAMLGADSTSFGQQGNLGSTTPSIVTPKTLKAELVANYTRMCPGGDLPTVVQNPSAYAAGLRMLAIVNQFQLQAA